MPASAHFAQNGLQPFLELAAKFRAGNQRADVERDHALVLQALGHVGIDDAQGQTFGDGRFAHARFADQHGIVLGRRESTWITRRISWSRPMTGSSLPCRARSTRSMPYRCNAWNLSSGV